MLHDKAENAGWNKVKNLCIYLTMFAWSVLISSAQNYVFEFPDGGVSQNVVSNGNAFYVNFGNSYQVYIGTAADPNVQDISGTLTNSDGSAVVENLSQVSYDDTSIFFAVPNDFANAYPAAVPTSVQTDNSYGSTPLPAGYVNYSLQYPSNESDNFQNVHGEDVSALTYPDPFVLSEKPKTYFISALTWFIGAMALLVVIRYIIKALNWNKKARVYDGKTGKRIQ